MRLNDPVPRLTQAEIRVLDLACRDWSTRYGSASREAMRRAWLDAVRVADRPPLDELTAQVERVHVTRFGPVALRAELDDERARDRAVASEAALVAYEARWARKLSKLQRRRPGEWRVPGLSKEEVRDDLTLRLLEAVRAVRDEADTASRPGAEWGWCVCQRRLGELRRRFRVEAAATDFSAVTLLREEPSQEERWLEYEADACRAEAETRATADLSVPQRRWLGAMKLAARSGAFFEASGRLNLSAASRTIGRDRSSAQRAYASLERHFQRALAKVE